MDNDTFDRSSDLDLVNFAIAEAARSSKELRDAQVRINEIQKDVNKAGGRLGLIIAALHRLKDRFTDQ